MNHFVQEALLDRLEEIEDVEDVKKIRHEPTRPPADVLKEFGIDRVSRDPDCPRSCPDPRHEDVR